MLEFEVNNLIWNIVFVPWNNEKLYRNDNTLTVGMCDAREQIIYISNYISGEFLRKVIIHELVHAFVFSYGLNNLKLDCEERIADMMASHGAEILAVAQQIWNHLEGD